MNIACRVAVCASQNRTKFVPFALKRYRNLHQLYLFVASSLNKDALSEQREWRSRKIQFRRQSTALLWERCILVSCGDIHVCYYQWPCFSNLYNVGTVSGQITSFSVVSQFTSHHICLKYQTFPYPVGSAACTSRFLELVDWQQHLVPFSVQNSHQKQTETCLKHPIYTNLTIKHYLLTEQYK